MKTQTLFRGKLNAGGKWVYGMPTYDFEYIFNAENCDSPDNFAVNPRTIGQFTGLTDKNGKKIFKGDIVQWVESDWKYIIKFANGAFSCYHIGLKDFDRSDLKWGGIWRFSELAMEIEVIGNIHDNPELL